MTQQPQALLITKAFWAMALQSNKSRQTACQKHVDLADSEALTRWETALPAYPSLRQLKLDGENIKEAEPAFEAVGKLPAPQEALPQVLPSPPLRELEENVPLYACQIPIHSSRWSSNAASSVMPSPISKQHIVSQ